MALPLMMAKRAPGSTVMVVTRNALGGTSPPAWSAPPWATLAVGLNPIGQKGLRLPFSTLKADLFLSSMAGSSAANLVFGSTAGWSAARRKLNAAKIDMETKRIFFIALI